MVVSLSVTGRSPEDMRRVRGGGGGGGWSEFIYRSDFYGLQGR